MSTVIAAFVYVAIVMNAEFLSGTPASKLPADCVQEPRDIFLVVDGSSSIGWENFQKVRTFLVDFVSTIDISPESSHIGFLQFSDERNIKIELELDNSQSKTAILKRIKKLKYQGGPDTRTDLGLKEVLEKIFTGSGGDRENVKDVLIVFTDGNSRKKELTIKYANKLKQRMVRIFAIGAGPKRFQFKDELQKIASSPQDVMMVDFNNLHRAFETLVSGICPTISNLTPPDCVQEPRDIFLVVDGSASIGGENFQKVRKFLVDFVSSIDISPGSNHLGILQFSDKRNIKIELKLDHSQSQTAILRKIEKLKYQGGSDTRTDLGLKKVLEKIFTGSGGDRKNVKDLLIVFTDGNSRDKELTIKYANELKQKMVRILAIGAGPKRFKFKDELQNIASSPQDVMMVDFNSLHRAVKTIVGEICPSTSNLTPPTTSVVSTTTPGKGSAALTTTAAPTTTTAPTSIPKPSVCVSSAPKNILFVVDSSAGYNRYLPETRRRLNEVKILVEKIISGLKLDRFKVGIMQFGGRHNPRMVVEFYQGDDMVDVLSRLKSIEPWYGLQRKTGEALTMASYKLYEVTTSHERHNAQNIIVLITSGLASDQDHAKSELKMLEWRNVRVITVGVGSYPQYLMNYLKPLATVNDLFLVKYNQLRNTANNILDSICSNGRIAPGKKHPGAECGKKPYDIFFLMDGSSSINYKNFDKIRKFTMDLLILLKTMASDINIGFMQFSEQSKTKLLLKLGGHQKKTELELIQTMKYQSGKRTMAGDALSRVNNEVFTGQQGDRSNVDDILFFLTDGNAHDYLKARKMARIMKEKGVRVVTIGAGASVSVDKLREIASGPDFSMSVNFSDLPGLAEKVISRVCGAL